MALAEHNDVVKAFPSDRTDQPFSISILPRGARRRRSIADAYRSKPSDEDLTIGAVPVTNEITGSLFAAAGFRDLICDPICGRMRCDAKPRSKEFSLDPRLSLSETSSGWRLTENRAMLLFNEGSFQAHWLDGCRSISVAGSARGRDLDIAAANKRSAADCS